MFRKIPLAIFIAVLFFSCSASKADDKKVASLEDKIQFGGLVGEATYNNGYGISVFAFNNASGKSIVAIQGTFSIVDDLGNVKGKDEFIIDSTTEYFNKSENSEPLLINNNQVFLIGVRDIPEYPKFVVFSDEYFKSMKEKGSIQRVDPDKVKSSYSIKAIKYEDGTIEKL